MTEVDRQLQALSLFLGKKFHGRTRLRADAIDIGDIEVDEKAWLTEDDIKAAGYILSKIPHDESDLRTEAFKRGVV